MNVNFPLAVEIEINSDCNLACPYCPNSIAERKEKGHMDRSLFVEILSQLQSFQYSGRVSYHFYNEPTLSDQLVDYIKLTRQYLSKARIDLYSNGTNLDKAKIEELTTAGVDKFSLTKHFKSNTQTLEKAVQILPDEIKQRLQINSYKDIQLTNRGGALQIRVKDQKPPLRLPCFIPNCALVITVKGNVVPCYEDYFQKHVMGNVLKTHILDIWNSETYLEFRNTLKAGNRDLLDVCKTCNNAWIIS